MIKLFFKMLENDEKEIKFCIIHNLISKFVAYCCDQEIKIVNEIPKVNGWYFSCNKIDVKKFSFEKAILFKKGRLKIQTNFFLMCYFIQNKIQFFH